MKALLGILLILFFSVPVCHSQISSNDTVRLTKLPPEGILLDKGWKFHSGDDFAWAKPDFNDGDWQTIDPSLDIRRIPQIQNVPVFWMRLKLTVDSSLTDQPLGITLSQVGASEIYLDGILVYKFGTVSEDIKVERTHYILNRPFSIKLGSKGIQTIAVRYSFNPKNFLVELGYENSCFHIILKTMGQTYTAYQQDSRAILIREITNMSLWLLLSLICFGLYYSFRSQNAYLYIGIYSVLLSCSSLLGGLVSRELTPISLVTFFIFSQIIMQILSTLFALNGIYILFNERKNWVYYGILSYGLFVVLSFILFYNYAGNFYLIYFLLYSLEFFRVIVRAIRQKRKGVILLFFARSLFFIFILLAFISFNYLKSLDAVLLFGFLAVAVDPLGWSLFMAGEYARTSIALQAQLREVEQLSEIAIAQEREKQRILSSQNETLESKVSERTFQLNESLTHLRSTQAQLIQSEKMASLGELTAGIAHEIQNPLNFVNNFSEINKELIAEMKQELTSGNVSEASAIADNIYQNEDKINHHGKRADAIVKGMLQHSRAGTGHKESIELNRLIDEYLRISYQGIRTRDNTFNIKIETHFDPDISKIDIDPQEIGRVLLNLYNNAFYAVTEKKKQHSGGYEPVVTVSTVKKNDMVEIRVTDNGNGIPGKLLDKIFQPFFTTKPTGQGTGLGLSMSYDIIKAHRGELNVESQDGEGAEFVVLIPIV
jgi:two-component system, NtrC family, sensor kinase